MTLPPEMRWQFVWRNPMVPMLVQLAHDGIRRLAQLSGRGAVAFADGEVTVRLNAVTKLADRFGVECLWHDGNGNLIDPPRFTLAYSWLAGPGYGGATVRGRRQFRGATSRRLRDLGITARRTPSRASLDAALAVWDAREGWTGAPRIETLGYDLERTMSLEEAVQSTGSSPDHYYRAFQLVSGLDYSAAAWLVTIGWLWQERQHFACYKRRNSGWREGTRRRSDEERAIIRFFELLRQGIECEVAIREARLSPRASALFLSPEHRDRVLTLAAEHGAVEELLARL
jgi:hypothetical protein